MPKRQATGWHRPACYRERASRWWERRATSERGSKLVAERDHDRWDGVAPDPAELDQRLVEVDEAGSVGRPLLAAVAVEDLHAEPDAGIEEEARRRGEAFGKA